MSGLGRAVGADSGHNVPKRVSTVLCGERPLCSVLLRRLGGVGIIVATQDLLFNLSAVIGNTVTERY